MCICDYPIEKKRKIFFLCVQSRTQIKHCTSIESFTIDIYVSVADDGARSILFIYIWLNLLIFCYCRRLSIACYCRYCCALLYRYLYIYIGRSIDSSSLRFFFSMHILLLYYYYHVSIYDDDMCLYYIQINAAQLQCQKVQ